MVGVRGYESLICCFGIRISLSNGLVGPIFTDPRKALENRILEENKNGWNAIYFIPHKETNLVVSILQIIVLVLTLFLWTWGGGYMILFEKETDGDEKIQKTILRKY